jgi:hypothetical protein
VDAYADYYQMLVRTDEQDVAREAERADDANRRPRRTIRRQAADRPPRAGRTVR